MEEVHCGSIKAALVVFLVVYIPNTCVPMFYVLQIY